MAPRETEDNAYANFWGDKQRALWYAMVFSGVVNLSLLVFEERENPSTRRKTSRSKEENQ